MSPTNKLILICDESKAKGFNDKPASDGDPIGVVAGLLLTEANFRIIEPLIAQVRSKFEPKDGKLHVTGISPLEQEQLRKDVYEIIQNSKGVIVYEAITQDGFHNWYNTQTDYWNKLKAEAKEKGYGYTFSDHKKRLQTTLFLGCFLRALAYIEENEDSGLNFDIDVLTDTIDKPILEEIEQELRGYLSFNPSQKIETVATRFNYTTKAIERHEGTIEYDIVTPDGKSIGDLSGVKLSVRIDNQNEIIADVLSNSIAYHLEQSFNKNKTILLSTVEAISEHPLIANIVSLTPEGGYDMNQALYQFEINPEEIKSDGMRKPQDFAKNIKFTPKIK